MQIRARGIHSFGYHDPNPLVFTPRRGVIGVTAARGIAGGTIYQRGALKNHTIV